MKPGEDVFVKSAFDRKIPRQRTVGGHVGPDPLGVRDDRRQACCRRVGLGDIDRGAWIGEPQEVCTTLPEADIAGNSAAARGNKVEDHSRDVSEISHAADTAWRQTEFQTCQPGRGDALKGARIKEPFATGQEAACRAQIAAVPAALRQSLWFRLTWETGATVIGQRRAGNQRGQGACAALQGSGNRLTTTVPASISCRVRLCRFSSANSKMSEHVAPTVK